MGLSARIALFPVAGPFHTRWPRYNVVHVRDSVRAFAPHVVALTPLYPGELTRPGWQDTAELPLPHTVVPWATNQGIPVVEVGLAPDDPQDPGLGGAAEDLKRYLELYEDGQARLRRVEAALAPVRQLLSEPLDLDRVVDELVPAIERQQALQTEELGTGPGDDWREARAAVIASRSLTAVRTASAAVSGSDTLRLAIVAEVDRLPALRRALTGPAAAASGVSVEIVPAPPAGAGEEGRVRALLDAAMSGIGQPESLLRSLAAIEEPEARYHEANLLLEHGHPAEALERLEKLVGGDFQEPYYLPGFALARLGQLRDLAARREDAVRSYRGVMALSYAPKAAREAAEAGLSAPFTLEDEGS
ncbi:MAG TPA: hypothetical protein VFF10_09195 [Trueperaceae bacterium]|nr:hypothetical protein [Trueperaceae bacterium]